MSFWRDAAVNYRNDQQLRNIVAGVISRIRQAETVPYGSSLSYEEWSKDLKETMGSSRFAMLFSNSNLPSNTPLSPFEVIKTARYGPVSKPHEEADVMLPMVEILAKEMGRAIDNTVSHYFYLNGRNEHKGTWFWDVYLMARSDWADIARATMAYQKRVMELYNNVVRPDVPSWEPQPDPVDPVKPGVDPFSRDPLPEPEPEPDPVIPEEDFVGDPIPITLVEHRILYDLMVRGLRKYLSD